MLAHVSVLVGLAASTLTATPPVDVFVNGEPVPGLPYPEYEYGFQIPVLLDTTDPSSSIGAPQGALLAFAQGYVVKRANSRSSSSSSMSLERVGVSDGNDGWIDIVLRRSLDGGRTWDRNLTVVLRNSTLGNSPHGGQAETHACQQPAPVVDHVAGKVFLLSSVDNWHMVVQESADNGVTWTPWAEARNLDATLRMPGWGLVFAGLPGGLQLRAPNPHAGRLVVCSSAYWEGGEIDKDGRIVKTGDMLSRYSYMILSDDHGATWRIGSGKIGPRHTTECSVAQDYSSDGALYMYARIWDKTCMGCEGYGRGIATSLDGGVTWSNATLSGLPDSAPDVEGSFASGMATVVLNDGNDNKGDRLTGKSGGGGDDGDVDGSGGGGDGGGSSGHGNSRRTKRMETDGESGMANATPPTCFYVSAPEGSRRANLTLRRSCGSINAWESTSIVVDAGSASYSAIQVALGSGAATVYELWAWDNSTVTPNECKTLKTPSCRGGIRFVNVFFPRVHLTSPDVSQIGSLPSPIA